MFLNLSQRIAALAVVLLTVASPLASAQIFRAYLSLDGLDTNPCTVSQPCRLLPAALAAVADGGEIWMLDSANFNVGPVNVAKSVTILAVPGAVGSVVALGGNAINVTAAVSVALRNLNILPYPGNSGFFGVSVTTAGSIVVLQNCNVTGFNGGSAVGVNVNAAAQVDIIDSVVNSNYYGLLLDGGASVHVSGSHFDHNFHTGILARAAASTTRATVIRSTANNNTFGMTAGNLVASTFAELSVVDSQIADNANYGVTASNANSSAGATAKAAVSGSQITANGIGVFALGPGARIMAKGNLVSGNNTGMYAGAGTTFETTGDNALSANGTPVSGTITNIGGI